MGAKLSKKKKGYCLGAGKDGESTETTEVEQKETETLEEQKGAAEPNGEKPSSDQAQNNDVSEKQSDQAKSNGASEKQNDQEGKRSSTEVTSGDKTKDKSNKDQKPESIPSTEQKPIEESKQSQAEPLEVAKGKETQESLPVKEQEDSDIIQAKQCEAKPAASAVAEKEEVADPVTKVEAKKIEKSPILMQKTEQISQQATQEATNTEDSAIQPEKSITVPEVLEPENVVIETVVQEAVVEPLAQESLPKPVVESSEEELVPVQAVEPSVQDLEPEPVVEPSVQEPVLVVKPPLQEPVSELVVEPPVQKPVPELVVEPPVQKPVPELVVEPPVPEPMSVMEPPVPEPVSVVEPPVQEPPVPVVEPLVCVVETPESVPVLVVEPPVQEANEENLKAEETHLSEFVTKAEAMVNEQHAEPVSIVEGVKPETDYESCAQSEQVSAKKEEECPSEVPDQTAKTEGNLESALPTVKSAEQVHEQNGPSELLAKDMQVNISTVQEVEDKGEHNEANKEDNVLDKPSTCQVVEIDSKDTAEVILETSKSDDEQTTFKDIQEAAQDKAENQETPDGILSNEKESPMQMSNKHGVGNGLPLKEEIKVCLENGSDKDLHELNGQGEGPEIQVCNE